MNRLQAAQTNVEIGRTAGGVPVAVEERTAQTEQMVTNQLLRALLGRLPDGNLSAMANAAPILTPLDERIRPARTDATNTEEHMINASRGSELAFYTVPQLFS